MIQIVEGNKIEWLDDMKRNDSARAPAYLKALCADETSGVPSFLAAIDDLFIVAESLAALRTMLIAPRKPVLMRLQKTAPAEESVGGRGDRRERNSEIL